MNPCLISPVVFLVNTVIGLIYGYTFYAFLFFQLILTSLYYHGIGDLFSTVLDKATIATIVSYGGYVFLTKIGAISGLAKILMATVVVLAFLSTIYFYYYGKQIGHYCFHEDQSTADWWHAGLHVISSLGHMCIMLL